MRKGILKKVIATLGTVAMAVGMLVSPKASMKVEAAESTLYVYGSFNSWTCGESDVLTSSDGVNYTGELTFTAEDNLYIEATKDKWDSCIDITSATCDDMSVSVWDDGGTSKIWIGPDENTAGTYTVTYNSNTKAITFDLKTVSTVTYSYEYYVAGETTLEAESWSNSNPDSYGTKGKMTVSGTTYTYTAATSEEFDGTEGYNIIKIGTPDDGSAKTIVWLKNGDTAFTCNYTGKGSLTITFDSETETSTCSFVADKTESSDTDGGNSSAGDTDAGNTGNTGDSNANTDSTDSTDTNVSTKNDITVEVTIDSSLSWKNVYLYAFNWDEATNKTTEYSAKWPGTKMTLKDGKYVATINTTTEKVSYQVTNGTDQTWDMKDIKATNGKVSFTMSGKKDSYGKYEIVLSENVSTSEKEETVAVAIDKAEIDEMSATVAGAAEGTTITLNTINTDEVAKVETFKSTTLKGMKFQALDIKLMKGIEVIAEPGATVTVKVTVPKALKSAKAIKIFRLDGEKLTEVKVVEFKDGMVSFETDHFSTYVFAEAKVATTTVDVASETMLLVIAAMAGMAVIAMKKKSVNA